MWLSELPQLKEVYIPRCFVDELQPPESYQLHHFGDAPESGYGCVSYLRITSATGLITTSLVMAKARVAPLKTFTIPRLELSAATLAVRLDQLIKREVKLPLKDSVFWTDSTAVLKYISNDDKRFHTFVANRIAVIQDGSQKTSWRYVESQDNPADDCSRGLSPKSLVDNHRWLHGPNFLVKPEEDWPKLNEYLEPLHSEDPEVKGSAAAIVGKSESQPEPPLKKLLERFSSWFSLIKAVVWLLRIKTLLQAKAKARRREESPSKITLDKTPISVAEMSTAETEVTRLVQKEHFPNDIADLTKTNKVRKSSRLIKLNPVLVDGTLRVKGRLGGSLLSSTPCIMPKDNHVTNLLIQHFHRMCGHAGREYVLSEIRKKHWILHGNSAVRQVLSRCVHCKKIQGKVGEQKMADIPNVSLGVNLAPFAQTAIDFFGPFMVKRGRTQAKRYVLLCTCLTTRAVHLEVTFDLSKDSFIAALNRM